jgi:hypothetical protein
MCLPNRDAFTSITDLTSASLDDATVTADRFDDLLRRVN